MPSHRRPSRPSWDEWEDDLRCLAALEYALFAVMFLLYLIFFYVVLTTGEGGWALACIALFSFLLGNVAVRGIPMEDIAARRRARRNNDGGAESLVGESLVGDEPPVLKEGWKWYEWSRGAASDEGTDDRRAPADTATTNYGSMEDDKGNQSASNSEDRRLLDDGCAEEEEQSCSICLCDYDLGEKVVRLPCGHIYHASCLNAWIDNHARCPLCNHDLGLKHTLPEA